TAQLTVTSARGILPAAPDLAGEIGRAVLASLHGPRRPRVCARKVESPLSRWNKNPAGKPPANLRITALTTVITDYQDKPATPAEEGVCQAVRERFVMVSVTSL